MNLGNSNHLDPSSTDQDNSNWRNDLSPSTMKDIMALGYPCMDNILEKYGFVISYNSTYKVPNIVCELLTHEQKNRYYLSRKSADSFFEDLHIKLDDRATEADYYDSAYTKGHLAAAANHAYNFKAYTATYCYSNIVPMFKNVNQIISQMENEARVMAEQNEKVYICTGPVFYADRVPIYIKEGSKVRVPDSIFKVIAHMEKGCEKKFVRGYEVENSAYAMSNDIRDWKKTLPDINNKTGLRILGDVDTSEIVDVLHPDRKCRRSRNIGR